MLALAAIVRQRWWTAAALLAVPVFIKIWPVAIVLLLVFFWPRQLAWRFIVACAVLALVPFLTRPPSTVVWQYREWYEVLTGKFQGRWGGYRDAWTIWKTLCPPVNHHLYCALQLISAGGVFGWCWWQYRRLKSALGGRDAPSAPAINRLLLLILSLWASWQLFFGPAAEQLTYGIIAPSASWAVIVSVDEKRARWLTLTAWAILALLASGEIERLVTRFFPGGVILLPLGVLLVVGWLVWHECGCHCGLAQPCRHGWTSQPWRRLIED